MGNNIIEFKIPENCTDLSSINDSKNTLSDTCMKIQTLKISCRQIYSWKGSALGLPKKAQLMGTPNWSF